MGKPRVAFVVQRCGAEVNGGAEFLCLQVAREMQADWEIEIITTTALDYMTWDPHYPAGLDAIDGIAVRRFDVDKPRAVRYFDSYSQRLLPRLSNATLREQEEWMRLQGPYSTALLRYLEDEAERFDAVFFFTYLYATTYFGLPLVERKSVLVPFAHDEWPIHMSMWNEFFARPRCVIFSTPEERHFLRRRFASTMLEGPVVGVGIRPPIDVSAERFRRRFGIRNPYALYVGRIDPMKGCEELLAYFAKYKQLHQDDLILVLLGREAMPLPQLPYLRALGFVEEATKFDAMAGAEFLVMPSALESLSMVLLESWSVGRPVLVNASSDVLVGQSRRANGGLWYGDAAEFTAAALALRSDAGSTLGQDGRTFVEGNYTWSSVAAAYRGIVERLDDRLTV